LAKVVTSFSYATYGHIDLFSGNRLSFEKVQRLFAVELLTLERTISYRPYSVNVLINDIIAVILYNYY